MSLIGPEPNSRGVRDLVTIGGLTDLTRTSNSAEIDPVPVQEATKIELVINLKTAKTLRITMPSVLVATADEVIE